MSDTKEMDEVHAALAVLVRQKVTDPATYAEISKELENVGKLEASCKAKDREISSLRNALDAVEATKHEQAEILNDWEAREKELVEREKACHAGEIRQAAADASAFAYKAAFDRVFGNVQMSKHVVQTSSPNGMTHYGDDGQMVQGADVTTTETTGPVG